MEDEDENKLKKKVDDEGEAETGRRVKMLRVGVMSSRERMVKGWNCVGGYKGEDDVAAER